MNLLNIDHLVLRGLNIDELVVRAHLNLLAPDSLMLLKSLISLGGLTIKRVSRIDLVSNW